MANSLIVISDAAALGVCAIAVLTDLRRRRIPNQLTVSALAFGLALALTFGFVAEGGTGAARWFVAALVGALLGLVVFGLPAALDLIGMGDVKLVVAVGALLRWPLALPFLLYVALCGGAVALLYAGHRRRIRAVARNVISLGARGVALHRMPYALAIALGCAWAVASRHVELLRVIEL